MRLHDISKSCGLIPIKLGGHVGSVTMTNCFDFCDDTNPDPRVFQVVRHHLTNSILSGQARSDL